MHKGLSFLPPHLHASGTSDFDIRKQWAATFLATLGTRHDHFTLTDNWHFNFSNLQKTWSSNIVHPRFSKVD